jgi:hypothetical protein
MPFKSLIFFILLSLTGLILTSCAKQAIQPSEAYTREQLLTQQAEQSLLAASDKQHLPEQARHLLDAAQIYYDLDEHERAAEILDRIDSQTISAEVLAKHTLLSSRILLVSNDFLGARYRLTEPKLLAVLKELPDNLQVSLREMRSELFSLMGDDALAIKEYVELSHLQSNMQDIEESHNKLWQILNRTPEETLLSGVANPANKELRGWYDLALTARRSRGDLSEQQQQIRQWRARWQNHPASNKPPLTLVEIKKISLPAPDRIAVLLPLEGSYGRAGEVIRNGLLAAYYDALQHGSRTPSLHFYDTSGQQITELYQQAIANKAEIVIGPLRKENLATLNNLDELPVPVMGLNYLDDEVNSSTVRHNNLYQFGLSVTDEAQQVAKRTWLAGYRSALIVSPANNWGEKARASFSENWSEKGGKVITSKPYPLDQSDFTDVLKPAFLIDQGEIRAKIIQRTLGKKLEYNSRRRQDVDMIFMVAQPAHGRSIKPTLDFFYAHDLPVYATSHLYDGIKNVDLNRDLNGIHFGAMPWTLPGMISKPLLPEKSIQSAYRHLYTLGVDAYQLHQGITLMNTSQQAPFFGHTGTLTMTAGNIIKRTLPWAEFRNNKVRATPTIRETQ